MNTIQFFSAILDWLLADPAHLVAAASGLAAILPTPNPASWQGKLFKVVDVIALNVLHAKETGMTPGIATNAPSMPGGQPSTISFGSGTTASVIALACLLSVALSACAGQTPQKDLFEVRASYDASVLAPLVRYHQLPICPTASNICKDPDVDRQLIKADQDAKVAFDAAETAVVNNPSTDASALIADAQTAASVVSTILANHGIK